MNKIKFPKYYALLIFIFLIILSINLVSSFSVTYNFNATYQGINSFAYSCDDATSSNNPSTTLYACSGTLASITTNAALDNSDNSRVSIDGAFAGESVYSLIVFNLSSIDKSKITLYNFTYEGQDTDNLGETTQILFYNHSSSSWYLSDSFVSYNGGADRTKSNYTLFANDFFNSSNYTHFIVYENGSGTRHLRVDFIKLEINYDDITINSPSNNFINNTGLGMTLNTSVSGFNNTVWYTFNGGKNNYTTCISSTNSCGENQSLVTVPRNNSYNLTVYANRSDGTSTSKTITNITFGSLSNQNISFTHLLPNATNFSNLTKIGLSVNITDDDLWVYNISFYFNNSLNFSNSSYILGQLVNRTFNGLSDGLYTYFYSGIDSDLKQSNSTTQTFRLDTTPPLITFNIPSDFESFTSTTIRVNYTIVENGIGLSSCWWSNSSGLFNYSITCGNNFTVTESGSGNYNVTIWANDSLNNYNSSLIHYTISTNAPAITLNNPTNNYWFNNESNIIFNITATDGNGILNLSLYGNWTGSFILNQTNYSTVTSGVPYQFYKNLTEGFYNYNAYSCDTTNQCAFASTNFSFGIDTTLPQVYGLSIGTVVNSQTIIFNHTANDLHTNNCSFSIYNSSGLVDGLYNNVSLTCSGIDNTATVSDFGTYTLTICTRDLANNGACNSSSFTTSSSPITLSVSGGGLSQESLTPVVCLIKPENYSSDITNLERCILYARINEYCFYEKINKKNQTTYSFVDYSESCNLKTSDFNKLINNLSEIKNFSNSQISLWYSQYKSNLLENLQISSDLIEQYDLVQSIIGILFELKLNPAIIDKPFLINTNKPKIISYLIYSNKALDSCTVLSTDNRFSCELISPEVIKISYDISNPNFFSNTFQAQLSVLTVKDGENQESKQVPVMFRVYNLSAIPIYLYLFFGALGILTLFIIFRRKK